MLKLLKAYKFRLYPNEEQKEYFAKCFGCARFIYNTMLYDRIKIYNEIKENGTEEDLKNIKYPTPAQYKNEFEWLREVDSLALANEQLNLNKAYKNFFRDKSVGFPKFKSRRANKSYTTNNQKRTVYIEEGRIKLPKLKSLVKIKQHRQFSGIIKSCTVSQTKSRKYYISILVETEIKELAISTNKIGVDVGLKEFAICSDGERFYNPKWFRKSEKRLQRLQRDLSRKEYGSSNWIKAKLRVSKIYEKIVNQRNDFLHKVSIRCFGMNKELKEGLYFS